MFRLCLEPFMLRIISIFVLFVGVIIGLFLSRGVSDQGVAPAVAGLSASSGPSTRSLPSHPSSSSASLSVLFPPFNPVTLQDISVLSDPAEFNGFYERLSSELISELIQLRTTRDHDRVISRITPIAQKFYYLKKAQQSLDDVPAFHLAQSFGPGIQNLEDLWSSNDILAQAADSVFSHLELLDGEHVPYQLREKVLAQ